MILGLFLGIGAAVGREWVADVLRTPRAVEQVTGKKCVVLPMVEARSAPIEEYVLDAPYSRFTEALRNIKALIDATERVTAPRSSASCPRSQRRQDDGRRQSGLADGRVVGRPHAGHRQRFPCPKIDRQHWRPTRAKDCWRRCRIRPAALAGLRRERSGLHVLPCVSAARIPNSAELLGSPEMGQLLAVARKSYDYIIIEIAPGHVGRRRQDDRALCRSVRLRRRVGRTKRNIVLDALSDAEIIRDRLAGVVLNKADPVALRNMESYKGDKPGDYYRDLIPTQPRWL